uniref:Copper transport protein n=1 Tax=Panagrolaimus sp. ES5 TaxID=591445 RepID=A0AC34FPU5_9BILA
MDHAHHNHAAEAAAAMPMDHINHDMSGMNMHMAMFYHIGSIETILFRWWSTKTAGGILLSSFILVLFCFFYEGIKWARVSWKKKAYEQSVALSEHNNVAVSLTPSMFYDAILHALQLILGYSLMLVFMTFNIWLCGAVVFGEVIAHLVFRYLYPEMSHDHHGHDVDHSEHDHGSNSGTPQLSISTTVAQAIHSAVQNATQTIVNATTKPLLQDDHHAHHNHEEDHSNHQTDHSAHVSPDHSAHAGHQMKMWFHGGSEEVILFDFWRIESALGLIISFILIFALGAFYEGLKWFRIYLQMKDTKRIQRQRRALSPPMTMNQLEESVNKRLNTPHHPNEALLSPSGLNALLSPSGLNGDQVYVSTVKEADDDDAQEVGFFKWSTKKSSPLDKSRMIQAGLYCVQITVAYFLMLIAMTYNIWLTAAVVLGAGFGHWLFSSDYSNSNAETMEAVTSDSCH